MIRIILLLGFLILVTNVLALNFFVFNQKMQIDSLAARRPVEKVVTVEKPIDNQPLVASPTPIVTVVETTKTNTVYINQTAKTSTPKEFVIPMGSGTVGQSNDFVDVYSAQTAINTSNYPKIKQAYFEVVMHLPNAQGEMEARLVDDSTPYIFAGQVLKTQSGSGQLLSTAFPIQTGDKKYHVQLKSTIGDGVLDSARIRLFTQ